MTGSEARAAFLAGCGALQDAQTSLLQDLLASNASCQYGARFGFGRIGDPDTFRRRVPLVSYEDIRHYVDAMVAGEKGVLSSERVLSFFKTSGSMAAPKLIPVTPTLMRQKINTFAVYWSDVYATYPALETGRVVNNFTDSGAVEKSEGGVDVLSEATFWGRRGHGIHTRTRWPLPPELRAVKDPGHRNYAAARLLLQGALSCIMCLNPSTLLFFCRVIENNIDALLSGLRRGDWGRDDNDFLREAAGLDRYLQANADRFALITRALSQCDGVALNALWPQLELAICWRSNLVKPYLVQLAPYLRGVAMRDFITQSSECAMAVPLADAGSGGALAYRAHFFEFIAESDTQAENPATCFAWELEPGGQYEVVVTTGGGLYRYRMGDCIRVNGFMQDVPIIEFLYRLGKTSSMTGEKLTEFQVLEAFNRASGSVGITPGEFICFPRSDTNPHYGVLLEVAGALDKGRLSAWVAAFDRQLKTLNPEYEDKRESGRLGGVLGLVVAGGDIAHYRRRCKSPTVSDEQVKPDVLSKALDVDQFFNVQGVVSENCSC